MQLLKSELHKVPIQIDLDGLTNANKRWVLSMRRNLENLESNDRNRNFTS